jgi:hypothetical protein
MSATISYSNLFTYSAEDPSERVPVENLMDGDNHVHGLLQIEINGRALPHMGFFGPDDVCFNAWVQEISNVLRELGVGAVSTYTFDEGEQGQPAFQFRRAEGRLFVSIVDSPLSDAAGDPEFQNVSCAWSEFVAAASNFFASFRADLLERCPSAGDNWWRKNAHAAV